MFRTVGVGVLLVGLALESGSPLGAQVRVTPKEAKGGEKQGEPWAEVPDTFKNLKLPDWPVPTDLRCWQNAATSWPPSMPVSMASASAKAQRAPNLTRERAPRNRASSSSIFGRAAACGA